MTTKCIFLSISLVVVAAMASAQSKIKLTRVGSNRAIYITAGAQVEYVLKNQISISKGKLTAIYRNSIAVEGREILLQDLQSIARKKTFADFGMSILSGFSNGIVMSSVFQLTPTSCLSYNTANNYTPAKSYEVMNTLEGSVILGSGFTTVANDNNKSSTNKRVVKWVLEIID